MTRSLACAAAVICLASGSVASAKTLIAHGDVEEERDDPLDSRTDVGFGLLAGSYSVGPVHGSGVGLHLDLGHHFGPLALFAEYDLLAVGEPTTMEKPIRGHMHRGGLSARYSFFRVGGDRVPIQGDFWAEGGLGLHRVAWDDGGVLDRTDISFGVGGQANFIVGRDEPTPRVIGFYYAFRGMVMKAPGAEAERMATCGGPCDRPTEPSPYDLGLFFNVGLTFGR